jgi:hypothetical protein
MDKDEERRLESLDRMKFDYKVVSEDSQTITVFLKIKPQQEKDSQRNVAGEMVKYLFFLISRNALS